MTQVVKNRKEDVVKLDFVRSIGLACIKDLKVLFEFNMVNVDFLQRD